MSAPVLPIDAVLPDLLAALEKMYSMFDPYEMPDGEEVYFAARAAIAKAKGETI